MAVFKNHEKQVIDLLTQSTFTKAMRLKLYQEALLVDYSYSGAGYFLTVSHDKLPSARAVYDSPLVHGMAKGIESGFIIFIENKELTIECHSWETNIPEGYRELDISVSIKPHASR